ncbi:hypothetical protein MKW92_040278, partial [Papaver armeniacum]
PCQREVWMSAYHSIENPQKHTHNYCKDCPNERSKNEDILSKCKGHLMRSSSKSLWSKCGCDIQCGNRVLLYLSGFLTRRGKGWGIRSLENLPRGAFRHTYPVTLDLWPGFEKFGLKDEEALCLDAT